MAKRTARIDNVRVDGRGEAFFKPILPFYQLMGGVPGVDYEIKPGVVVAEWPLAIEQSYNTIDDYANFLNDSTQVDLSELTADELVGEDAEQAIEDRKESIVPKIIYFDASIIITESNRVVQKTIYPAINTVDVSAISTDTVPVFDG